MMISKNEATQFMIRKQTMSGRRYIKRAALMLLTILYIFSVIPGINSFAYTTSGEESKNSYLEGEESSGERKVSSRILELFLTSATTSTKKGADVEYYIGGEAFGVRLDGVGIKVVRAALTGDCPLKPDDKITKINGRRVQTVDELRSVMRSHGGGDVLLEIEREGKKSSVAIKPSYNGTEYNLGVILTDTAAGIGTLTYVCSDGSFGGLGHGISDGTDGTTLPMRSGAITGVILAGSKKSECGMPGELRGVLTDDENGTVIQNTPCGIFGIANENLLGEASASQPVKLGSKSALHEGEASIICTVGGTQKKEYSIKIEHIDKSSTTSKSFRIKVIDDELISLTGGIVRGMSGSPIIQDGKLVGAVTHVLVANPTEGYGIFIENMLNAAQNQVIPKAA